MESRSGIGLDLALFLTCRQIYAEASSWLFFNNTFSIWKSPKHLSAVGHASTAVGWLQGLGAQC